MGVQITDLLTKKQITLEELRNKTIAVDAPLFLYQFLTTIRQVDGTPLMDSKGNITSHLTGLFSRSINLIEKGIKLVYVFDGKPPALKEQEREKRKKLKLEAEKKYKIAVAKKDIEEMKKYAARTTRLTPQIIKESKELLDALGIPIIEAPSEGEAQAAFIVKQGNAFAVASQDADCLMFGSPRLIRNLSVAGKRKKADKLAYETIQPELITLAETLNNLGIDNDQLIALSMLVGTDYNPGGIKGIGPKNALKLVKQYGSDFDKLFKEVKWDNYFDKKWTEIYYLIKKIPVTKDYNLKWSEVDIEKVKKILIDFHDFSEERVNNTLARLKKTSKEKQQKSLGDF